MGSTVSAKQTSPALRSEVPPGRTDARRGQHREGVAPDQLPQEVFEIH